MTESGVTNTRCCRYSCMRSWWCMEKPLETCRAVSRYNRLCNVASCWMYIRTLEHLRTTARRRRQQTDVLQKLSILLGRKEELRWDLNSARMVES